MPDPADLRTLTRRFAGPGRLQAIMLRPARGEAALAVQRTEAHAGQGLVGDRSYRSAGAGNGAATCASDPAANARQALGARHRCLAGTIQQLSAR